MIYKSATSALFSALLLLVIAGCRENPGADSGAVRQELRQREIVHLNEGQITQRAVEIADSMLFQANAEFLKILENHKDAITCKPALDSSIRKLERRFPVRLRYLPFGSSSARFLQTKKEKELMEASTYSMKLHYPLAPNLQKDGEKEFIYTSALILKTPDCQSCHLQHAKPELRGGTGDTIGIKMLRLSRKQVVMSFVE